MHFSGLTYRPPYEASSLLLQVSTGCSHNRCTFCSMYRGMEFSISPMDEIEADLREVSTFFPNSWDRIFLVNGDAFALPADQLEEIAKMVNTYLPGVKSIGGYASIKNIRTKTDDELRRLAKLKYADINIGVESGLDDVLSFMNKGYTLEEARTNMLRLNEAGLPFNVNIINGAAGPARIHEHAEANAALMNEVQPTLIFVSPLHVDPGTPLEDMVASGEFEECSLGQYIEEEIAFLEGLEQKDCTFFGMHISNPVAVLGQLPQDKDRLLQELREGMDEYSPEELNSHPHKGAEGSISLKPRN